MRLPLRMPLEAAVQAPRQDVRLVLPEADRVTNPQTPLCACGRPSPSAVLCRTCVRELGSALLLAANIAGDLDDAVARLLKRGSGGPRASGHERPLPIDLGASDTKYELRNCLSGWIRVIFETRPDAVRVWPSDTVPGMARWLASVLDVIRQHEAAQDMHDEITDAVERAYGLLDRAPAERLYAGPCPDCGTDLLGQRGASVITCRCGTVSDVDATQGAMREKLKDQLGSASWCASMATATGVPLTENTVKSWVQRKRLVPRGMRVSRMSGKEYAVYRFGDVLKRADERPAKAVSVAS